LGKLDQLRKPRIASGARAEGSQKAARTYARRYSYATPPAPPARGHGRAPWPRRAGTASRQAPSPASSPRPALAPTGAPPDLLTNARFGLLVRILWSRVLDRLAAPAPGRGGALPATPHRGRKTAKPAKNRAYSCNEAL